MTEQLHNGKILLSEEDMKECKQISPDEPSVTEQSCSHRNHGKLLAELLIMLMMLISQALV